MTAVFFVILLIVFISKPELTKDSRDMLPPLTKNVTFEHFLNFQRRQGPWVLPWDPHPPHSPMAKNHGRVPSRLRAELPMPADIYLCRAWISSRCHDTECQQGGSIIKADESKGDIYARNITFCGEEVFCRNESEFNDKNRQD
jgi:hypothetical protein